MKRIKLNWAIPGLLAMILVIVAVAWAQTQSAVSPDPAKLATQCAACHTMDKEVNAWKESTHKDVACTACHADPGVKGWVDQQLGHLRMLNQEGKVDASQVATKVPNERCIACHAREMPWVMQDLKPAKLDEKGEPIRVSKEQLEFLPAVAGHDVHLTMDKPLNCTSCHSGVSHGPAAENRAAQVERMHGICLDCHAQEKVSLDVRTTTSCSACHLETKNLLPEDHKSSTFTESHGKSALKDVTSCQVCHLNPGIVEKAADGTAHGLKVATPAVKTQTTPSFPAGTLKVPEGHELKDNCATCHGITMPHPKEWLASHAQGFNEKPELCATCHGDRDKGLNTSLKLDPKELPTQSASCTGCHAQPMPHPENFQDIHGQVALQAPQSCEQCHSPSNPANPTAAHASPKFCQECHQTKFSHPGGYVAKHAADLSRYGGNQTAAGCTQCHTPTVNSCTACHTAGVGNKQQWHPTDFVGTHDDTLARFNNSQTAAGCTQCHVSSDPKASITACTTCHTSGVGNKTQWHPENWWIGHARTTKPSDATSCKSCHAYVEPSCSQCHTKF